MARELFELTPISEKPEVFGSYYVIEKDGENVYQYWFDIDGWSIDKSKDQPDKWFKPVPNIYAGSHSFVQYHPDILLPDGIYNGKYNKEPAVIKIRGGRPVYVSFIGFLNAEGESRSSAIFDEKGIMASNVELLLKSQTLSEGCFINL